jgi:hypothetical protein
LKGRGFHWEVPLEPAFDAAGEDSDTVYSETLKQKRRPDARNLIGSSAVQNDILVTGNLLMMAFQV